MGAAFEAAFQGVPAFASSVWRMQDMYKTIDSNSAEATALFAVPATITRQIIDKVMTTGFPKSVQVVAINMPYDVKPDAQWVITEPHAVSYGRLFSLQEGKYVNVGNTELEGDEAPATDLEAIAKGYVSIVPISLQLTTKAGRQELSRILNAPIFKSAAF